MRHFKPEGVLAGFHAELGADAGGLLEAGEQWAADHHRVRSHAHAGWELYLQVHGTSRWDVDGRLHRLAPMQLLAVPPATAHELAGRPSARHHFFYAAVDLQVVLARHPELAPTWATGQARHAAAAQDLEPAFRVLVREVATAQPFRAAGLAAAVDLVVLGATRALGGAPARPLAGARHPSVTRAQRLLEGDPGRRWSVAALAEEVGLSAAHFAELFSRQVGQPPHEFLTELRLERARGLLRSSDLPVTAIALELGFGSSQHFARVFGRRTGRTPGAYRRSATGRP